jgi:myo-inositol-1(or 4)-monophosphatase
MATEYDDLLALARHVATEAGATLRAAQRQRIEVEHTKSSPTDIVTDVDLAVEKLIRERLAAARPDDGFLGEESGAAQSTSGDTWVVDPIDGTVNFLYRIPHFSVSIALQRAGQVVAGVVHNPMSGELFGATLGGGATLDGRPIATRPSPDISAALVATGFSYRSDERAKQIEQLSQLLPKVRDIRRMGSAALDLCQVACGRTDAYAERNLQAWDMAAGTLIAREAGARVEGLDGAAPSPTLVVAASADLFDAFHDLLVGCGYRDWTA